MVTFFTSYLGGTHGTAKSARDFLRALLACQEFIRVISPAREQFPSHLCGEILGTPEWYGLPTHKPFSLMPNKFTEWLKNNDDFFRLRRLQSHDTVIVNGWASYEHWQGVKDYFAGPKAIIVRESPRHFKSSDRSQVTPDLLKGFSTFDHLIFVSKRGCDEWREFKELKPKSFSVIPNCCEEEEIAQCVASDRDMIRDQLGFRAEDFVLFCPGTIEHRKGQDLLLKAIPVLQEKIRNLRVLFVGDPVSEWGVNLLQSISDMNLSRTLFHWPSRPEITDLLHASDLLVFPSRAEAMPRTILEAMVSKTPIVASNVDGIPELIVDGETGLLFVCDDVDGLLNATLRLFVDADYRRFLSEAGEQRYWANFSRSCQFQRMPNVLKNIQADFAEN